MHRLAPSSSVAALALVLTWPCAALAQIVPDAAEATHRCGLLNAATGLPDPEPNDDFDQTQNDPVFAANLPPAREIVFTEIDRTIQGFDWFCRAAADTDGPAAEAEINAIGTQPADIILSAGTNVGIEFTIRAINPGNPPTAPVRVIVAG